jgi:intein/homing endonuclease
VPTPDGDTPISDLDVGDTVLAYNEDLGTTGWYTVTATFAHLDPIIVAVTIAGETLETTPEHPFFVLLRGGGSGAAARR